MEKLVSKYQLGDIVYCDMDSRGVMEYVVKEIVYTDCHTGRNLYTLYNRIFNSTISHIEECCIYPTKYLSTEAHIIKMNEIKNKFKSDISDISSLVKFCIKNISIFNCEDVVKKEAILERAKELGINVD